MRHQQRSSAFLADFIHDIIETDYKADVLRELSKQCQNQANLIKAKGNEVCNFEHKKLEAIKEELDDLSRHKDSSGNFVEQYKLVYDTVYRKVKTKFDEKYRNYNCVCLLCSEPTPERCHRRLLAEMISKENDVINHI